MAEASRNDDFCDARIDADSPGLFLFLGLMATNWAGNRVSAAPAIETSREPGVMDCGADASGGGTVATAPSARPRSRLGPRCHG